MFSILHISDLHRSSEEPVDNNSLLAALLSDSERFVGEAPVIPPFDAIIVSGDLIEGVALRDSKWEDTIVNQYRVAGEFLDHLTRRFLGGDRSKIIIVPGNHDVCWNTSLLAMEKVPKSKYPSDIKKVLIAPDSSYRWSWKDLALYRIIDFDVYHNRMVPYWDFIENFYSGVSLVKPIDRNRGYQLFELRDHSIVVAAFDSICGNDCFSYSGLISRGTVGKCSLELRDFQEAYALRIAVWHHSTHGPPLQDDYMDIRQLHEMIGLGFQIGIHGHQHVSATATHHIYLNENQAMVVISSGSLCAGSRQLPRGVNRQYNVIVIEDDLLHARVHVREMTEGEQFSRKSNGEFFQGFVQLSWKARVDSVGRPVDTQKVNKMRTILQAEEALHSGNAKKAISLLRDSDLSPGSHARRIAIEAAIQIEDWVALIRIINQPHSSDETIFLLSALIRVGSLERATEILADDSTIAPELRKDFETQIKTKKLMRGK